MPQLLGAVARTTSSLRVVTATDPVPTNAPRPPEKRSVPVWHRCFHIHDVRRPLDTESLAASDGGKDNENEDEYF